MTHDQIKSILISIFIGACVSFLTAVLTGLLDFLHQLSAATLGAGAGISHHYWTKSQLIG